MFAEKACNLIKEVSRCEDVLPPYNLDLVKEVCTEVKQLHEQNKKDGSVVVNESGIANYNNALYPTLRVGAAAVKRNIRCLIAYHYNRIRMLREMRWEFGSVLPADIKTNLSRSEVEWFSQYSRSLAKYMRSIGEDGLNLGLDMRPPKALYIEVRCLVDYGKYELSDGTVLLLKKDSRHYLPRSECEELIKQGVFQHII
ncbi:DNA replication complex GINS protein PSF1-like [Anthonomus grandis grandis]|uniref:DNA replication complex GINS protein PSF1-like n=1 Tax=Anthonomus grandis grandis TaxID=2921223 RepID=UPI002165CC95|nr:DNA replication complex GINS protein PSF1-like [Anthonomus grandis grandis]